MIYIAKDTPIANNVFTPVAKGDSDVTLAVLYITGVPVHALYL